MIVVDTKGLSLRDFMSDAGLSKWVAALGAPNAPVRRAGIAKSLEFFARWMPHLRIEDALDFLFAMDLTKPVSPVSLSPGTRLIAFRFPTESPFKLFYARRGASPHRSGIDPTGRSAAHFVVRAELPALESFTTSVVVTWGASQGHAIAPRKSTYGAMGFGGGAQLIIPQSYTSLLVAAS